MSLVKKIINNLNIEGVKKLIYLIMMPVKKCYMNFYIKNKYNKLQKHYKNIILNLKSRKNKVLRFAAYVIYESSYGFDGGFKIMMKNKNWLPKIVVIPDISRGMENAKKSYIKTKNYFINKYGKEYVIDGWNLETNEFYDNLSEFDIVYYANPYDAMVNEIHSIKYGATKDILPIYVTYGYEISKKFQLDRFKGEELNSLWKCYTDTFYTYQDYQERQIIKGKNVKLIGYSKMDELEKYSKKNKSNKTTILISSHHTVTKEFEKRLPLSNFLKYYNFILELPKLYPNINFVFRPHPLLFTNIVNAKIWTQKEVDEYLNKINKAGISYSTEGDYLKLFSECDAIINDCGSFTIEWLFTGKPSCFMMNPNLKDKHLTTLMKEALKQHYIAFSKEDIINFIDKECLELQKEYKPKKWVRDEIMVNYPNVSEKIINDMENSIYND